MKVTVIGAGYVGLVTGACFADSGNSVCCLDIDERKISLLNGGGVPIYEPGLSELISKNLVEGRISFTTDIRKALSSAEVVFLAVGTPPGPDGSADLSSLWKVVDSIAANLGEHEDPVIVTKSTVPVGTCSGIEVRLKDKTGRSFRVASNPEFLKEGAAIEDFQKPDRVVVGVRTPEVGEIMRGLYSPFLRNENPFIIMSPESSEMTKYVANALLATKISFINEAANLCELMSANIDDVRRGIGHDERIGFSFLFPGVGYGGSCFPKDVQALIHMARLKGLQPRILESVHDTNLEQKKILGRKIEDWFGDLRGRKIAVWGLSFKPKTDDIRDAPSLELIDFLLLKGASIRVHDPAAMENVRRIYGDRIEYASSSTNAVEGADCLAIMTEWGEYRNPDLSEVARLMKKPVVFDGRNLFSPAEMKERGFSYNSIGR